MEFADCLFEDAGKSAPPSGVDNCDGTFLGINEKNGDTVGGLDSEEEAGRFGERGVAFAGFDGGGSERPNDGRMDLFEIDEREFFGTETGLEPFAVFEDIFASIPFGKTEVEDFLTVEVGNTAWTCAETVDEPGKSVEGVELEDF